MYLTKKEVADVLRVSVRTITSYMKLGVIPDPKKVGRTLLWDEDELHNRIRYSAPVVEPMRAKRGRPRKVLTA